MAKTRQKKSNSRQRKRRTYRGGGKFGTGNKMHHRRTPGFGKSDSESSEKEFDYTIKFIDKGGLITDLTAAVDRLEGNFFMSGKLFDPNGRNLYVEILTKAFGKEGWEYILKDDKWVHTNEGTGKIVAKFEITKDIRKTINNDYMNIYKITVTEL